MLSVLCTMTMLPQILVKYLTSKSAIEMILAKIVFTYNHSTGYSRGLRCHTAPPLVTPGGYTVIQPLHWLLQGATLSYSPSTGYSRRLRCHITPPLVTPGHYAVIQPLHWLLQGTTPSYSPSTGYSRGLGYHVALNESKS